MLTEKTVYSLPSDHPNYCSPLRPFPIPDATSEAYGCWNRWLNGGNQIPSAVHDINGVLVVAPESWSETAVSIAYTRWAYKAEPIHERSIYDMAFRLAYTWATRGFELNYFDSQQDASEFMQACFEDILLQRWFPNSPQWFNTGIYDVYGIEGESCGLWKVLEEEREATPVHGRYVYPQVSACFIQGVEDDLTEGNGILPSIVNEARLFKMGSGVGSNWSPIRHNEAPLSNGGHSSGLISFLRIGDTNAGAIKSGGTTRRAAKMVVLDVSHPDIVEFVEWKLREDDKVSQMAWASQQLQGKTPQELTALGFPKALIDRIALGHTPNPLDLDFNGEAVQTVSGQNSNNSIRIPDSFLEAVDNDGDWPLLSPVDGSTVATVPAKMLWDKICLSAWACADPGVQFSDLIEAANPVKSEGTINASNPCLTGDTLVLTSNGYKRIDSLTEEPFEVMCGDGVFRKVNPAFKTGDKEVFEVELRNGKKIRATEDHLVLVEGRDVAVCDLSAGDILNRPENLSYPGGVDGTTPELVGLMLGDGCISQGIATLTLDPEDDRAADIAVQQMNDLKQQLGTTTHSRIPVTATQPQMTSRVSSTVPEVIDFLAAHLVMDEGCDRKRFRDAVLGWKKSDLRRVLSGLFSADGTVVVSGTNFYVGLDSTSIMMLEQVQTLLETFGVQSRIYRDRRTSDTALLPDGQGGLKEYRVKQTHSLRVTCKSVEKFAANVGFLPGSKKDSKLRNGLAEGRNFYSDAKTLLAVKSVTPVAVAPVYDITEPVTSHFVANGLSIHNCSEFLFLDNTSCNLASTNLVKLLDENGRFDSNLLTEIAQRITTVLDISVEIASFPSKAIAEGTYAYRTLGMGFSNLGGLLMALGIPYDSDRGRDIARDIAACMMLHGQLESRRLGERLGSFRGLSDASWEVFCKQVDSYGYTPGNYMRNAQHMVIAPCGTIGLGMDCDALGIEPALGLITYKKMADSDEVLTLVNSLVPRAMESLGFTLDDIHAFSQGLLDHNGDFYKACEHVGINPSHRNLDKVLATSLGTPNIPWEAHVKMLAAVQPHISGGISKTINMPEESTVEDVSRAYRMAHKLGVKCVALFRNGCKDAPYSVKSSTIPDTFTADELKSLRDTYVSNAAYDLSEGRDVRHIEERLSEDNTADGAPFSCEELEEILAEGIEIVKTPPKALLSLRQDVNPNVASFLSEEMRKLQEETAVVGWGRREPLSLASAVKVKATVAGQHTMHVTIPTFDDGAPSEVFVETGDTGSATNALMDTVARLSSKCLQMGLPVDELVDLLQSVRFEPSGIVNGPEQFKNINGGPLFVNSPLGVVAKALKLVEARRQLHDTIHDIVEERLKSTSYPAHDVIYVSPEVHEGLRDDVKHADSHPVAPLTARLNNERCPSCKSPNIIPSGVCKVCADCGESVGGCS